MSGLACYRFRILFGALLILLITYPYLEEEPAEAGLLSLLTSAVLLVGVYAVSHQRITLWLAGVLAMPALLGDWWPVLANGSPSPHALLAFEAAFFLCVTMVVFHRTFTEPHVSVDTLFGTVCVYLLMGLAWAGAYTFIENVTPGSFKLGGAPDSINAPLWSDLLFFSFTALTTVGYGDMTPVTSQARSLATMESTAGVLYLAVLVARLLGLHLGGDQREV